MLYECESWSLTLREERRLRVFENRVLRRIFEPKGRYTLVTLPRNVTPYRDSVDGTCDHVSKVGYAVTLRACSMCCRYLAVASKGWYGYGLSRCGRAA